MHSQHPSYTRSYCYQPPSIKSVLLRLERCLATSRHRRRKDSYDRFRLRREGSRVGPPAASQIITAVCPASTTGTSEHHVKIIRESNHLRSRYKTFESISEHHVCVPVCYSEKSNIRVSTAGLGQRYLYGDVRLALAIPS